MMTRKGTGKRAWLWGQEEPGRAIELDKRVGGACEFGTGVQRSLTDWSRSVGMVVMQSRRLQRQRQRCWKTRHGAVAGAFADDVVAGETTRGRSGCV